MHDFYLAAERDANMVAVAANERLLPLIFGDLRVGIVTAIGRLLLVGGLTVASAMASTAPARGRVNQPMQPVPAREFNPAAPWTLQRAVARAVEANPDVLAAKYEVERQEGARLQIQARMLPSVTATAGVNQREAGLVDLPPSELAQHPATKDLGVALFGYDMQIELRQTLFDGFSSWNATKRQKLQSKQAFLNLKGIVGRTVAQVRQGFDAILMRTEAVAAERRRVDEFEQLVKLTERKNAIGDVPEFELLRAEAELEGARADLAEAIRAESQAEQSFRRLLQIPASGAPLRLDGQFVPRPFDLPLADALSKARANRPDLEAAGAAVEAARRNLMSDVGTHLPRVDAFATYGSRTSYYTSSIRLNGWTYGLSGQWNLFESGAGRGRRVALRADLRSAQAKLAETEQGLASQLTELYQGLQQARVAIEAQQKSVSTSDRAAQNARRQYEVGAANLEQVLQADITHRRAVSRLNEVVYSYNSMVAEIELSVGGQISDSLSVPETWKP
jgi:outer membrane protein TolC